MWLLEAVFGFISPTLKKGLQLGPAVVGQDAAGNFKAVI
jgi:hypothetical protein